MPVKTVLVVDDSPTERHVLVELLSRNGYQVITAENGEEGIEKARRELPDLILMDVVMPGLNGYQATQTLTMDGKELTQDVVDSSTWVRMGGTWKCVAHTESEATKQ